MMTEDKILIDFLNSLLNQARNNGTVMPNGQFISGNITDIKNWLNRVLNYYNTNKIQIETNYIKKNLKINVN